VGVGILTARKQIINKTSVNWGWGVRNIKLGDTDMAFINAATQGRSHQVLPCSDWLMDVCLIHTKFSSQSSRNCWNFCDISNWALPTALRILPRTKHTQKKRIGCFKQLR